LTKDIAIELSVSRLMRDGNDGFAAQVRAVFDQLQESARSQLAESGVALHGLTFAHSVDARYVGQNFELPVVVDNSESTLREQIRARFHEAHRHAYGYAQEPSEMELVTFRLRAVLATEPVRLSPGVAPAALRGDTSEQTRPVIFEETGSANLSAVVDRSRLAAGDWVPGPAIIEQMDTTTIVPPGFAATVDPIGNLRLSQQGTA